jgi:hypothetical protein
MRFQEQCHYDQPPEILLKIFSDKDYFLEKYARSGAGKIELLEDEQTVDCSRISVRREVDMEIPLPRFARKYIPHTVSIVQTDTWRRQDASGHIDIRVTGMPARVSCDMSMQAEDQGTTLILNFSVRVKMPLIGEALAELLAADMRRKVRSDERAGRAAADLIAARYPAWDAS